MAGVRVAAPLAIRVMILRLPPVLYSMVVSFTPWRKFPPQRRGAVRIKDRFAAIECIENGCEGFVTEPLISPVAQQAHTFGFERIKRVFDLAQAGVDIRQGQHSEQAETAFVVGNEARTVFVFPASKTPGLVDVSEPDTGRGNRDHGSGYAAAIHVLDGSRRCVRLPGLVALSLLRIHHRDPCG